jgi:phosphoribosylamine--glycine ligase
MKIAVLGSGGREHAISEKMIESIGETNVFVLPGNGGTRNNVEINVNDFEAVKSFCEKEGIDLIFVGPEEPLTKGIVDYFSDSPIKVFGPAQNAAQLEGSKIFSKKFMKKYDVSTAEFWIPINQNAANKIIENLGGHLVVKYDGLAAGKGVFVCSSKEEAQKAIKEIYKRYGDEAEYLIERKFKGQEISIIGFTDGQSIKLLQPSQDHKPIYEGDTGPNTGGMGAFCPVPFCDNVVLKQIETRIVKPTLKGISAEGFNYKGLIYFGIMMGDDGPNLLEYNVRFGDPETEALLPALKSDLLALTLSCFDGSLKDFKMEFESGYFVDVVLASGGYPGSYETGKTIEGLPHNNKHIRIYHAGTKAVGDKILTNGGRVLNVVGRAETLQEAIRLTYKAVEQISFEDVFYRKDIAHKGLKAF